MMKPWIIRREGMNSGQQLGKIMMMRERRQRIDFWRAKMTRLMMMMDEDNDDDDDDDDGERST